MPGNIVLVGFSGTGKSTVARLLVERLGSGWDRLDTDEEIVRHFGKSIADVFKSEGEAVFRAAERSIVAGACARSSTVISLGGGAVVDPESRNAVAAGNQVVLLDASPETIFRRLKEGPGAEVRPMLAGEDPLGRIRALKASRAEAYSVANIVVDTEGRQPSEITVEILQKIAADVGNVAQTGAVQ